MKVAEAFVELRVDDRRAQAEVRQRASALGGTFAQFFAAAAFGAGIKKAIGAASELEQSLGAVEKVLGANSKAVKRWADEAARSMGLSKTAANNALVLIVSQLKNFGYTLDEATDKGMGLVELGADLAATYGGSTTEAVQALTSALRGEMDPIERYGVALNEARVKAKALELGLYAGTGALDMNAKATAVLALITDQTATAQGQFAREADTAAGANAIAAAEAENAAASMGDKLLPIYTRAVEVVGWLAQGFGSLPAPLQYAFLGLAAIAALSGPIGSLGGMVRSAITAVQGLGTAGRVTAVSMGVLGGVVAVATLAYASYAKSKAEAKARTDEFVAALQAEARGQKDAAVAAVAARLDTEAMVDGMHEMGLTTQQLADYIMGGSVPAIDAYIAAAGEAARENNDLSMSTNAFVVELARARGEFADARDQVALTDAVMTDLGVTAADTGDDVGDLGGDVSDLEAAFGDLLDTLDVRDASRNVAEAFDRIRDAYIAIWDAEDKRPIDEKVRDYEQAVDDATRKVLDWAETLGEVPPETVSKILAEVDKGSFDEALAMMAAFERQAVIMNVEARGVKAGGMRGFAAGGYIDRDQVAMVHRNEVVLPLGNPGRVAALLGDPRVAPSVAAAAGGMGGASGPSLSIGSLTVGSRDDLGATTGALDRLLWRVS